MTKASQLLDKFESSKSVLNKSAIVILDPNGKHMDELHKISSLKSLEFIDEDGTTMVATSNDKKFTKEQADDIDLYMSKNKLKSLI